MKQLHYKPARRVWIRPNIWQWALIKLGYREHQYRWEANAGYILLQTIDGNMSQIPRWKWESRLQYKGLNRE